MQRQSWLDGCQVPRCLPPNKLRTASTQPREVHKLVVKPQQLVYSGASTNMSRAVWQGNCFLRRRFDGPALCSADNCFRNNCYERRNLHDRCACRHHSVQMEARACRDRNRFPLRHHLAVIPKRSSRKRVANMEIAACRLPNSVFH